MSFYRQLAAPVLLTVFGAVSVLGTGLHLLSGCGHFHGWVPHFHAHHHDCATPPLVVHHDADPDTPNLGTSHEDCEICRFLALSRALTAAPRIVERGTRFEVVVDLPAPHPTLPVERHYAARAPPSSHSNA